MNIEKYIVYVERPKGVTKRKMMEYITDAVATHRGSLRPAGGYGDDDEGDPLFYLNGDTVRVTTE